MTSMSMLILEVIVFQFVTLIQLYGEVVCICCL